MKYGYVIQLGPGNLDNRDHRVDLIGSVNLALDKKKIAIQRSNLLVSKSDPVIFSFIKKYNLS